jgi:hypothetical protein
MVGKRFIFVLILKMLFLLKKTSSEVSILLIIITSAIASLVAGWPGKARSCLAQMGAHQINRPAQFSCESNLKNI